MKILVNLFQNLMSGLGLVRTRDSYLTKDPFDCWTDENRTTMYVPFNVDFKSVFGNPKPCYVKTAELENSLKDHEKINKNSLPDFMKDFFNGKIDHFDIPDMETNFSEYNDLLKNELVIGHGIYGEGVLKKALNNVGLFGNEKIEVFAKNEIALFIKITHEQKISEWIIIAAMVYEEIQDD